MAWWLSSAPNHLPKTPSCHNPAFLWFSPTPGRGSPKWRATEVKFSGKTRIAIFTMCLPNRIQLQGTVSLHHKICGVCPHMWDYQSWWHFTPHVNYSLILLKSEDFHSTLLALQNIYIPNLNCRRVSPKHRGTRGLWKKNPFKRSLGNHHFQALCLTWNGCVSYCLHGSQYRIQPATSRLTTNPRIVWL